jgi:hypothetical protein
MGAILKVAGQPGAWYWAGHGQLRYIPAGQGMGTFLQSIGWSQYTIDQTALNEMVENFGRGADFT